MKYVIMGSGAIGGCIGAYLSKSGNDVSFIARGSHLKAMNESGLTIKSSAMGEFTISDIKSCTAEEYIDVPDVIFVCVKYYSIDDAIDFINRVADENTLVIPLLNVFGTGEVLQNACPKPTILNGCIYISSMIEKPGIISQSADVFRIYFGYRKNQKHALEEKVKQAEKDCNNAKIETHLTNNIDKEAIQKFSFVSPMGAVLLYYNETSGAIMDKGEKQDMFLNLINEIEALGHAMGLSFEEKLTDVNLEILKRIKREAVTSMVLDIRRGRESEIDGLIHRVVRLAKEYKVDMPCYTKISNWAKEKGIK